MTRCGEVKVYWGSMFSGKTTALMNDLAKAGTGGICFKPCIDNRTSTSMTSTHDGLELPVIPISQASVILNCLEPSITDIGIDEASLFIDDPTLVPTVQKLRDMGYNVIISGLDVDRNGNPFVDMAILASIADECVKFRAKCSKCGGNASISFLKSDDTGNRVLIGGSDKYEPRCRNCI